MKIEKTKLLTFVADMPKLVHNVSGELGEPFDIMKSKVAEWLIEQPGVRQWLFNQMKSYGLIEYDDESGTWKGVGAENFQPNTTGGRPKIYSMEMLRNALAEKPNGMLHAELKKQMVATGMSENSFYRLRALAVASGMIEQNHATGRWSVAGTIKPVPRGTPLPAVWKPKVVAPKPEKVVMTDEQIEQLLAASETPSLMRTAKIDGFEVEVIAIHLVQTWIEENVLKRKSRDIHEIYDMTNGFFHQTGTDASGFYFEKR